ncbi:hypothetical protein [Microtetraspora fusca]|uniref:hypothetical protein n=1 Tax=Microtetraspora fusca TaxID=1997 RepID=UPI0014722853|nr:hypothetical protein [Microtetraspora fusca]
MSTPSPVGMPNRRSRPISGEPWPISDSTAHRELFAPVPEASVRALADVLRDVLLALGDRPDDTSCRRARPA